MTRVLWIVPALALAACDRPAAPAEPPATPAHFKSSHGVHLPETMRRSLGVETAEVVEQPVVPRIEFPLHVGRAGGADGWISAELARAVRPGQRLTLTVPDGAATAGRVVEVRPSDHSALGDFEVRAAADAPLPAGATVVAAFDGPPTAEVATVPKEAVLSTAEGTFVYVANEEYFTRTPVKTAARSGDVVEIADGIFAGDVVVRRGVNALWMTELQAIRAGQSCCSGH